MSTQPAMPMMPGLPRTTASGTTRAAVLAPGLSATGVLAFFIGVLVVASGYSSLRPSIMGLALHPYLVPVVMIMPFVMLSRLGEFPAWILVAIAVFAAMYFISVFNGSNFLMSEVFKFTAFILTMITAALLVRKRGDFVAGALGLSIAVALLAFKGLQSETAHGIEVMEGANRNSYSIYALPALLLAGYVTLNFKSLHWIVKATLLGCAFPPLIVIFMGANRSGYLGAVLIGLMLFWNRRGKGLLLVGAIAGAVVMWIAQFGSTVVFNERMRQTVEGTRSDTVRVEIVLACLQIGLENPIIGISPQLLSQEIGRRLPTGLQYGYVDPHNLYAFIFAGSGLICFAALFGMGWAMWFWIPRTGGKIGGADDPLREPQRLLRMMVVLFAVRGLFTREVIYNPSFSIAFGLCIGLCMLADAARKPRQTAVRVS